MWSSKINEGTHDEMEFGSKVLLVFITTLSLVGSLLALKKGQYTRLIVLGFGCGLMTMAGIALALILNADLGAYEYTISTFYSLLYFAIGALATAYSEGWLQWGRKFLEKTPMKKYAGALIPDEAAGEKPAAEAPAPQSVKRRKLVRKVPKN